MAIEVYELMILICRLSGAAWKHNIEENFISNSSYIFINKKNNFVKNDLF